MPRFADAATIRAHDVERCQGMRDATRQKMLALLVPGLGLVIPTAPCIARLKTAATDAISAFYSKALARTAIAGHSGLPQVTLPLASLDGCPLGLSVLAAPGADLDLLDFASYATARD